MYKCTISIQKETYFSYNKDIVVVIFFIFIVFCFNQ